MIWRSHPGEFGDGLFGGFAEEEAHRGVFVREFYFAVVVVHNHLYLAEVLMGKFVELEVDDDVAAEEAVVEDEIHEVVVLIESEALLAGLEEEAVVRSQRMLAVSVAPWPDFMDADDAYFISDFVDYPIVADADTPIVGAAGKLQTT